MKRSAVALAIACLALGWAAMPLLPRAWGLEHVHGLFAGAGLYYVAYVGAAFPEGGRTRPASAPAARTGGLWRVVLARAAIFGGVLAALLYVVFQVYRGFDMRWHLATFAAWALSEDLAERFRPTRTREV